MDYMQRAIELAKKGIGRVNPNPLVGAVIVKDGRIIGEGCHEEYGGPHAEINAVRSAVEDVRGADMYVTLEPCSHHGKTPPCAEALAKLGFRRVYVGMTDPNPRVRGNGIKLLRSSGTEVIEGVMEDECRSLNPVFIKYITTGEPFVVMKTAMSLDGKIAACTGQSKWISSQGSRDAVQYMRKALMGVMVGINTVIADNPRLTCRISNSRSPIKIIVDSHLRIPENALLLDDLPQTKCIIATSGDYDTAKAERLKARGAEIIEAPSDSGKVDLKLLAKKLGELKIDGILLEGGGTLNYSALKNGIVDMAVSFIAPIILGGENAKTPVEGEGFPTVKDGIRLKNTVIKEYCGDCLIYGSIDKEV